MKDALQNRVVLGLSHHPALVCPILATSMGTTSFHDIHSLILPSNPNTIQILTSLMIQKTHGHKQ